MAVTAVMGRLAASAPVPVFVARGVGADGGLARLRASRDVDIVPTPRHATILLVAGAVPAATTTALTGVHDQVPAPRGVATVDVDGDLAALGLDTPRRLPSGDPVPALRELHRQVLAGRIDSPARGPADNPVAWEGVGPHGQGGEGMMGGTPYGRPMPMPPTPGRDGLALDRLSLRLGPFLAGLPPGVALDVGLQGDVLAQARLEAGAVDDPVVGVPAADPGPAGTREARRCLGAIADMCSLAGLGALARRTAACAVGPSPRAVADLRRRVDRRWGLRAATDGVGVLSTDGSDVTDRWRTWFDAALAALDDTDAVAADVVGAPVDVDAIGDALVGLDLGQAWLTLCSLQLRLPDHVVPDALERA